MNYRNQWSGQAADYLTYNSSFDFGLNEIHGGLDLIILMTDKDGVYKQQILSSLFLSRKVNWNNYFICGFSVCYFEEQLTVTKTLVMRFTQFMVLYLIMILMPLL